MNIRTCPHCNYKYSIAEYIKQVLFKFVYSEWDCRNCHKKITFNSKRRMNVALTFGGLYILLSALISIIKDTIGMSPVRWTILLAFYLIVSIFIFTFDTFKKAD